MKKLTAAMAVVVALLALAAAAGARPDGATFASYHLENLDSLGGKILDYLWRAGSTYRPSTIRTHVPSRMCANAPDHHAVTYRDFSELVTAGTG